MTPNAEGLPPEANAVLASTDWGSLSHAFGSASHAPATLAGLLADDHDVQVNGLGYLYGVLDHQNGIYSATPPAAVFVATIIGDSRTRASTEDDPVSVRACLLEWVCSAAYEVNHEAETYYRRDGGTLGPWLSQVQAARPRLFQAVSALFDDADLLVREWAVIAACPLLDDPRLVGHRAALVARLRTFLEVGTDRIRRNIAIMTLRSWGEDIGTLETSPSRRWRNEAWGGENFLAAPPW